MTTEFDKTHDEQLDKTGEFFTVGGPLHAVKSGYIRRAADDLLIESVLVHRYVHIAAANRTGKSSLIAGAAAHLENNGVRVAVLDLDQISSRDTENDPGRWYYNVAYRLLRQLRIRFDLQEWWQDKSVLSNRQRLLEFYSEILLSSLEEDIVIFVDSLQCVEELPFANQLLASIRSAFNGRGLDPDFMRLTFVMVGEYDPQSLVADVEVSPFTISQRIRLDDFSRDELSAYANEINIPDDSVEAVLNRLYYWTAGHPYLTQKLARAISRAGHVGDPVEFVDAIVKQQFSGRSSIHNEPHLSHIHKRIVEESPNKAALLSLYGRIRKGVSVVTDLGDQQQRRLIAIGLIVVDDSGALTIRNRIYEMVFTARWANEHLPTQWRAPASALGVVLLIIFVPFWYTQQLPNAYVNVLTNSATTIPAARSAWVAFRSFPGHTETADGLYRAWLVERARASADENEIIQLSAQAENLLAGDGLARQLVADFWERRARTALRQEDRDAALLATIQSLVVSTREKRNQAASLIAGDYPLLIDTLARPDDSDVYFDTSNRMLSALQGSRVEQWAIDERSLTQNARWELSALDVSPVVRRIVVDSAGSVRQIALRLRLSHQRLTDLSIRLIAPSGRSVPIEPAFDRAVGSQEITIPREQLRELLGEERSGTWSLSIRDQGVGVAGYLVAWNLSLNSQALIEEFERGINIPNPEETQPSSVWVDPGQQFVVARSSSGDSVRLWDMNFAKPVTILPVTDSESLVGFNRDGTVFVTATLDGLQLWDVLRGVLSSRIDSELATTSLAVLPEANAVLAKRFLGAGSSYELIALDGGEKLASLDIAGSALLDDVSADGRRLAVVDFDRSLRVWDLMSGNLLAQMDLRYRPADVTLTHSGDHVAVVYANRGVAQWQVARPEQPIYEELGGGDWAFAFSPTGRLSAAGRAGRGYQIRRSDDGSIVSPLIGDFPARGETLLRFSDDEQTLLTSTSNGAMRFWRVPEVADAQVHETHMDWSPAFDTPLLLTDDGDWLVSADDSGHVHINRIDGGGVAISDDDAGIDYLGHASPVTKLAVNRAGSIAASVSEDSKLKSWELANGQPSDWSVNVPTEELLGMRFAPNDRTVGLLYSGLLLLIDTETGDILSSVSFVEPQSAFTFFGNDKLFVGSASGALSLIELGQPLTVQVVWQGDVALTHLEVSPDRAQMIIADADNGLLQFSFASNEINATRVQLPAAVRELVFSPIASRLFVRTGRWMHGFSTSTNALVWTNAVLLPGIPAQANTVALTSTSFAFPMPNGSDVEIVTMDFSLEKGAGLFGNREELLRDWSARLGRDVEPEAATTETEEPDTIADPRAAF